MPAHDRPGAYPQAPVLGILMLQTRLGFELTGWRP
jgi:hypothetical protein